MCGSHETGFGLRIIRAVVDVSPRGSSLARSAPFFWPPPKEKKRGGEKSVSAELLYRKVGGRIQAERKVDEPLPWLPTKSYGGKRLTNERGTWDMQRRSFARLMAKEIYPLLMRDPEEEGKSKQIAAMVKDLMYIGKSHVNVISAVVFTMLFPMLPPVVCHL